jgi:hypothetical protein
MRDPLPKESIVDQEKICHAFDALGVYERYYKYSLWGELPKRHLYQVVLNGKSVCMILLMVKIMGFSAPLIAFWRLSELLLLEVAIIIQYLVFTISCCKLLFGKRFPAPT